MARTNKKAHYNNSVRKSKKVVVRFPKKSELIVKDLLKKYELKTMQALFDIMVVGGVLYKRTDVLHFIRKHKPKYKELFKLNCLSKMGKVPKPPKVELYTINMLMYPQDYIALKNYVIEENIKQQWIWNILFEDGFIKEEPVIINLIHRNKELAITSRKKAIARLSKDKYIKVLPEQEANQILEELTKEYDKRRFDDSLAAIIKSKISLKKIIEKQKEEDDADLAFNEKIENLRKNRNEKIDEISEPIFDD